VTDVWFDGEQTAFVVVTNSPIKNAQNRMTKIVENWQNYDYKVGKIESIAE